MCIISPTGSNELISDYLHGDEPLVGFSLHAKEQLPDFLRRVASLMFKDLAKKNKNHLFSLLFNSINFFYLLDHLYFIFHEKSTTILTAPSSKHYYYTVGTNVQGVGVDFDLRI